MSELYFKTGSILEKVLKGYSLKRLLSNEKNGNVSLLVSETLKYIFILNDLFEERNLAFVLKLTEKNKFTAVAMIYDYCFGAKKIKGSGKLKRLIIANKNALISWQSRLKIKNGAIDDSDLIPSPFRNFDKTRSYARIPISKETDNTKWEEIVSEIQSKIGNFEFDLQVPNLLSLTKKDMREIQKTTDLIPKGNLFIQDKSSCFPVLSIHENNKIVGDFIDACSAPGNKTIQLIQLLKSQKKIFKITKSKVFAFEIDKNRFVSLSKRIENLGYSEICEVTNKNFLDVKFNTEKYQNVKTIFLDPSCSGSGTLYQSIDQWVNNKRKTKKDISKEAKIYSQLQYNLICHAMNFPFVERIVYSTCSIDEIENEQVVERILAAHKNFELVNILSKWTRRGIKSYENYEKMVRVDPIEDNSAGFFVCQFKRISKENICDFKIDKNCLEKMKKLKISKKPLFELKRTILKRNRFRKKI